MHHNIIPDQSNPFLELGRYIHEKSYKDMGEKSVELPGMKMDIMWKEGEVTIVGEIKKSSKSVKGAKWQLLYYLYSLRKYRINAQGYILIPKEKKRIKMNLTDEEIKNIEKLLEKIKEVVEKTIPPDVEYSSRCKKCGYFELCFS